MENGRRLRVLTVVDLFDRRCPVIEVDHSLTGERAVCVLERLCVMRDRPAFIRTANGPECEVHQQAPGSVGLSSRNKTGIVCCGTVHGQANELC